MNDWTQCSLDECDFSADLTGPVADIANIMCAHYQSHIAEDLQAMRVSQFEQLREIRAISSSGFLNPRGPGEGPAEVAARVERRRTGYVAPQND